MIILKRKLSPEQVRQIRTLYAETTLSIRKIAARFNVSKSLIWRIVHDEIYRGEEYYPTTSD